MQRATSNVFPEVGRLSSLQHNSGLLPRPCGAAFFEIKILEGARGKEGVHPEGDRKGELYGWNRPIIGMQEKLINRFQEMSDVFDVTTPVPIRGRSTKKRFRDNIRP